MQNAEVIKSEDKIGGPRENNPSKAVRAQLIGCARLLCSPVDCNLPGSSVHGIFQARILEWVAMPSSRESS